MKILLLFLLLLLVACTEETSFYVIQGTTALASSNDTNGNATDTIYATYQCDIEPCDTIYWVGQT